jgi:hypothetical protein
MLLKAKPTGVQKLIFVSQRVLQREPACVSPLLLAVMEMLAKMLVETPTFRA